MRLDESALADVAVGKRAAQSAMQLRMHRHQPRLAALAGTDSERRSTAPRSTSIRSLYRPESTYKKRDVKSHRSFVRSFEPMAPYFRGGRDDRSR